MTVVLAGRYELDRRLGRGGMAEVWRGRDLVLGRRIAVKTVSVTDATDVTLGDRLRREAVATAALAHPDIVTVHDAGVDGDTAYLVMELVTGRNLATVLAGGALDLPEAVRVAGRVAGALAAAHAAGIVHRDIKPANIIVDGESVTVVDFGIAAIEFQAVTSLTAPGTTLGTAEYMAPEQARAEPATSGTDMYSFGCLLTALVTGRPPFTAEVPVAVLHHHAYIQAPRLISLRPDVPEELDALVGALLDKDPAVRPSATEAHERLATIAGMLSPGARPAPPAGGPPASAAPPESTAAAPVLPTPTATSPALPAETAAEPTLTVTPTAIVGVPVRDVPTPPSPRRRRALLGAAAAVAAGAVAVSATTVASRPTEPLGKLAAEVEKVRVSDAGAVAEPIDPPPAPEAPTPAAVVAGTRAVEERSEHPAQVSRAATGNGQHQNGGAGENNGNSGQNNGRTGKGQNNGNGNGNNGNGN